MNVRRFSPIALLAILCLSGCKSRDEAPAEEAGEAAADPSALRAVFQSLPAAIEVDPAKVELGNRLYHDPGLSGDGTISCASCHDLAAGGDDGLPTSTGIGGATGPINAPTTLNAEFNLAQFWDGRAADLQEQAAGPVTNPLEMGASWEVVIASLQRTAEYAEAFRELYPEGITQESITDAIAEFERTLVTPTGFDAWVDGDDAGLTAEELHGLDVFVSTGCATCHNGVNVGGGSYQKMGAVDDYFALRGGELTDADLGRFNVTGNESDRHFFKVPTLRNVELTAPYFHDGSVEELSETITIMAKVQLGRDLPAEDVAAIGTFLASLTGELPEGIALEPFPHTVAPPDAPGIAEGTGEAPVADPSEAVTP